MVGSICIFPVTNNVDTISASVYPFLGNVCISSPFFCHIISFFSWFSWHEPWRKLWISACFPFALA